MPSSEPAAALVLVTGATGFIGGRLCELLAQTNRWHVHALVRHPRSARKLQDLGVKLVHGDLMDPAVLPGALEGVRVVIHLAHGEDRDGPVSTGNLLAAAVAAKVSRFVHISSMSVHGPTPSLRATSEESATIGRYGDPYCDSKAEQEELVRAAMDRGELSAVILRPTVVYGPGSPFVNQILSESRTGIVTVIDEGRGRCNAVYVDDVCEAILLAMTSDRAVGEAMFVTADQAVSWREFILAFANSVQPNPAVHSIDYNEASRRLAAVEVRPQVVAPFPFRIVRKVWRRLLRLTRTSSPQSSQGPNAGRLARETVQVDFQNAKAKHLLGWTPRFGFAAGSEETRRLMLK